MSKNFVHFDNPFPDKSRDNARLANSQIQSDLTTDFIGAFFTSSFRQKWKDFRNLCSGFLEVFNLFLTQGHLFYPPRIPSRRASSSIFISTAPLVSTEIVNSGHVWQWQDLIMLIVWAPQRFACLVGSGAVNKMGWAVCNISVISMEWLFG